MRTLRARTWVAVFAASAVAATGWFTGGAASASNPSGATTSSTAGSATADTASQAPSTAQCARPAPGRVACMSLRRTDVTPHKGVVPHVTPGGYGPADLQAAYQLPSATAGAGQTVAIVDAFDDPSAESDLATYRAQYGLPPCTTANGCFRKVDQRGGTAYPTPDAGWAGEISLDIDMVSAACPNCHILLVEAGDDQFPEVVAAVDEAVALGAKFVSNSYGGSEVPEETEIDSHYSIPGVVMTVSSGDSGYGVQYPAASSGVTAVGGTDLLYTPGEARGGWHENAWSGAGSGCSTVEQKPVWQTDPACANRTVADVSAVADPIHGVSVYDTFGSNGWNIFGGTSVAAPIIASVYALAGTPLPGTWPSSYPYDNIAADPSALYDPAGGSNSLNGSCNDGYLCNSGVGYDGPTGLGSPWGVSAFAPVHAGHVAGTVTDSATGAPVTGAKVAAFGRTVAADGQGHYDLPLPPGDYQVTATAHGYQPLTASATVTGDQTTALDLALDPTPRVNVTGTVTDASGHGWPLYAKVSASDGTTTYTDPATGRYTLNMLPNDSYTLHVTSDGYTAADRTVSVGTQDVTSDVGLSVTSLCTAPGYDVIATGSTQSFDRTSTPKGWRVTTVAQHQPGYQDTPGWVFTDPGRRTNETGGTGNFAIVDSDHTGAHHIQDTYLTGPTIDLSTAGNPTVTFASDLHAAVNQTASVEVSTDGGTTWSVAWSHTGFPSVSGPDTQVVALPQAVHQAKVKVRFHYVGSWSQWWAVDDVFVGNRTCELSAGGLVVGQVTDAGTGDGLVGATVTSDADTTQHATTVATPDDPALGDGLYVLFTTATGEQGFTTTATGHAPGSTTAQVTADGVTRVDIALSTTG